MEDELVDEHSGFRFVDMIDMKELKEALQRVKNRKGTGLNGVNYEHVKNRCIVLRIC